MDKITDKLEEASGKDLKNMKAWLFRENIRVETEKTRLLDLEQKLRREKEQFTSEMKALARKLSVQQQRLKDDAGLFDKKMEILLNGFSMLNEDRSKLEREKDRFEREKERDLENRRDPVRCAGQSALVEALFKGVNDRVALKKRYKDLIKMYHPDNAAGDREMIQLINQEYDTMKRAYEMGRKSS